MYKIVITDHFKKQLKKLVKKDRKLKDQLKYELLNFNKENSILIGFGIYKIRLKRDRKGKSGGYRMYILIIEIENILTPICIYAKNNKENLTKNELAEHVELIKLELKKLLFEQ